jgi:CHRD domain
MVVVSTNGMTDKLVLAQSALEKFTADLSGKSEIPPVDTKASGSAQFQISANGEQIDYILNVKDLNTFMTAHTHQGKSDENGPPIDMLCMGKGKITSGDLQGSLSGEQLSNLAKLI